MFRLQNFRRNLILFLCLIMSTTCGFWLGRVLFGPRSVEIDTSRVEFCIEAYKSLRKGDMTVPLQSMLAERGISPREFEKTIDRIIHFRISQSSLEQTQRLLDVVRMGNGIRADRVIEGATTGSDSLLLDAAIITLIQKKPILIREAFGG